MDNFACAAYNSKKNNNNEKVNQNLCQVRQILQRQKNAKNLRKLPEIPPPIIRCPEDLRKDDKEFMMRIRTMEIEFPESRFCVGKRSEIIESETFYTPANHSTTSTESQLPLKFYSTDGKMKMLLTRNPSPKKSQNCSFPIIPEQLNSSKKDRNPRRNKFNANLCLGKMSMDISGIFCGEKLDGENVEKLVINGTSFAW